MKTSKAPQVKMRFFLFAGIIFLFLVSITYGHQNKKTFFSLPFSSVENHHHHHHNEKSSSIQRRSSLQTILHQFYGGEKPSPSSSSSTKKKVLHVQALSKLQKILSTAEEKKQLVVLDFTAVWCGPCKFIAPYFDELANSSEFSKVIFIKVDVDEASDIAASYQVNSMPTFLFLKNKLVVDRFSGASKDKLLQTLRKHK